MAGNNVKNRPLNINIGILGHVDCGKTSLAKCLSNISSTAAFDKHPQSQERGITIDLGFSSIKVACPDHLHDEKDKELQFTFVDCPGHASLLRTVIGGSQIIDMVLLVIDVTKGIQTQTAECLIITEITSKNMVVALNKVDLIPETKREATIEKVKKKISMTLATMSFKNVPIVTTIARQDCDHEKSGVSDLINTLKNYTTIPERHPDKPFVFAVDHCFGIKGQGTVLTGTVLQGSVHVNDTIEIASLQVQKKVKSMQMFRKNVDYGEQGDRLGICVKQLDSSQLERGLASCPEYSSVVSAAVISISKVNYFKQDIRTGTKFHVSIGYETVIAKVSIFSSVDNSSEFSFNLEYNYRDELICIENQNQVDKQYALLEFDKPVLTIPGSLVIGSKLDIDIHSNVCRIAFYGNLISGFSSKNYTSSQLSQLKVFKLKEKHGVVDRIVNEYEVVGKNAFKKESNIQIFIGFKVNFDSGETGFIESGFGQSGKLKIRIPDGLKEETINKLGIGGKKKVKQVDNPEPIRFSFKFKKYCYEKVKKVVQ